MKRPLCSTLIASALVLQVSCGDDSEPSSPNVAGSTSTGGAPTSPNGTEGGESDGGSSEDHEDPATAGGGTGGAESEGSGSGESGAGGSAEPAPTPDKDAIYAFTTQVFGVEASDTQSYVILTKNLDRAPSLDDAVIEVSGRALGTGPDEGGVLYLATDSAPSVTRYELSPEGTLEKGPAVSFLGQGVASFAEYSGQFQFVSDEKAYWFDPSAAKIIVFDPTQMTVRGSIALDGLAFEGEGLSFSAAPRKQGNKIYSFASWRTGPVPVTVPDRAAVIVLDTETDTAKVAFDTRCGYVRDGVLADDGYLYLATEALGTAVNYLNAAYASTPCLLRFDTDTEEFDASFKVDLETLFDGEYAGSLMLSASGRPLLRFLDQGLLPEDPEDPINTNARFLASARVWRWAQLSLGDEPSVELLDSAASMGSLLPFVLGGRTYAPVFDARASTEFHELTDTGITKVMEGSMVGLVFSAVKLR